MCVAVIVATVATLNCPEAKPRGPEGAAVIQANVRQWQPPPPKIDFRPGVVIDSSRHVPWVEPTPVNTPGVMWPGVDFRYYYGNELVIRRKR